MRQVIRGGTGGPLEDDLCVSMQRTEGVSWDTEAGPVCLFLQSNIENPLDSDIRRSSYFKVTKAY